MHHPLPASGDLGLLFLASLAGGVHCAGMCGPYVSVCSAHIAPPGPRGGRIAVRLLFNLGRIATYVAIGALAGGFGQMAGAVARVRGLPGAVSIAAGILVILSAAAVAGFLPALERAATGLGLGSVIRAGTARALRAPRFLAGLLLGGLQGLLPCAMVYGAASRAAAAASPAQGALTMLVFGLGTLPTLLTLTFAGAALPLWIRSRLAAAALMAMVGALLVLRGLAGLGVVPHSVLW